MKERKLLLKEDLTHADIMKRNKLWPLMEAARKEGKRASFRGSEAYIKGKKVIQYVYSGFRTLSDLSGTE